MASEVRIQLEPLRSLAFGGIGASYVAIGTATTHAIRVAYVNNLTDGDMMFSFGGVTDHFVLPAMGYLILDIMANRDADSEGWWGSVGLILYAKQITAPTTGSIYFSVAY